MKQTLITRLVLGAIAGMAAMSANAGQIQASSVSIAREAITADTQTVTSPSIAYRFAGDVDGRVQAQTFQVQFSLAQGEFSALPATIAQAISVSDGVTGQIQDQSSGAPGANSCGLGVACNASYQVVATGLSDDKKTLWATITVNQGATALIKQPLISLNVTANTIAGTAATNVSASRASVTKLYTVVGSLVADYAANGACQAVKTASVAFKHYVALTSPTAIASDTNATADEHTRAGATNAATLMTFPTNILPAVVATQGDAKIDPAQSNLKFSGTADAGDFTSFVSATLVNLGAVYLKQNATGYDANLSNQYLLAPNLSAVATAVAATGVVETTSVDIKVASTNGFPVGATLFLAPNNDCATGALAGTTITAANAAGPITLNIPTASLNAFFAAGTGTTPEFVSDGAAATYANVCMNVTAATAAIPTSAFSAITTVNKAPGAVGVTEQNNTCGGNLYSLGGGIKIDVRNYASSKETSGYQSVIRLINNSDARTADVYGQIIHQDGKFGGYGLLATLKPREVLNMTAAQIDAKLITAPAATAAADNGATAPAASSVGAPRLRITSNSGASLRVQNYLFNSATQQIFEASNGQGVDFEGTANRAPVSDGQYISQDANSGLNGK